MMGPQTKDAGSLPEEASLKTLRLLSSRGRGVRLGCFELWCGVVCYDRHKQLIQPSLVNLILKPGKYFA